MVSNINDELDTEGLDDDEINGYIMTDKEARNKDEMWNKLNAEYLLETKGNSKIKINFYYYNSYLFYFIF